MKKIILASILALSSHLALAEMTSNSVDPAFAKIESLVKANDMTGAYQELEKLAKSGNPQAIYNLGYLTQTGQGTPQNEKKAIELYEASAKKDYPVANYVLGKSYMAGTLGLKQDTKKAKQYLEKASNQGFADASIDLAILLFAENTPASEKLALQKLEPLIQRQLSSNSCQSLIWH